MKIEIEFGFNDEHDDAYDDDMSVIRGSYLDQVLQIS